MRVVDGTHDRERLRKLHRNRPVTDGDEGREPHGRAHDEPAVRAGCENLARDAPPGASGRFMEIDLVDWGVTDTVAVSGRAVPSSVPAGGGPRLQVERVALTALALGALMARSGSTAPPPGRSHVSRRTCARPASARPRGPSTRSSPRPRSRTTCPSPSRTRRTSSGSPGSMSARSSRALDRRSSTADAPPLVTARAVVDPCLPPRKEAP